MSAVAGHDVDAGVQHKTRRDIWVANRVRDVLSAIFCLSTFVLLVFVFVFVIVFVVVFLLLLLLVAVLVGVSASASFSFVASLVDQFCLYVFLFSSLCSISSKHTRVKDNT